MGGGGPDLALPRLLHLSCSHQLWLFGLASISWELCGCLGRMQTGEEQQQKCPFPRVTAQKQPRGSLGCLSCPGGSSPSRCLSVPWVGVSTKLIPPSPLSFRHRRVHVQQRWLPARLCQHRGELRVPLQGRVLPQR